jgi:hypothetical protein
MSDWLTLAIIVLVSVAVFADHRRNVSAETTDVGEPDGGWVRPSEPIVRPNVRSARHSGSTPLPRWPVSRRSGRRAPRG